MPQRRNNLSILNPRPLINYTNTTTDSESEDEKIIKDFMTRGLSGIYNFGATCYMNAALQALRLTLSFLAYVIHPESEMTQHIENRFLEDIHKKYERDMEKNNTVNPVDLKYKMTNVSKTDIREKAKKTLPYKLRMIMKRMWSTNCEVKPEQFKRYVDKYLKFFKGKSQQHDSQEFLTELLDHIHEMTKVENEIMVKFNGKTEIIEKELLILESNLKSEREQKNNGAVKILLEQMDETYKMYPKEFLAVQSTWAWMKILKSAYSVINDIFSGLFWISNVCKKCNKTKHTFERFDILCPHLPEKLEQGKTEYTLNELMTNYISPEDMVDANGYFCEYCCEKTNWNKKINIFHQPNVLVIMIKKYQKINGTHIKSNIRINYDHEFNLKPFYIRTYKHLIDRW